jgi:hypothetical protein
MQQGQVFELKKRAVDRRPRGVQKLTRVFRTDRFAGRSKKCTPRARGCPGGTVGYRGARTPATSAEPRALKHGLSGRYGNDCDQRPAHSHLMRPHR